MKILTNTPFNRLRNGLLPQLKLIGYWTFSSKNNVSFKELIHYFKILVLKANQEINKNIISINDYDKFNRIIYLKDITDPLYYPKQYNLQFLGQIIREFFGTIDWHKYEKMGTFVQPNDIVIDCGAAEGLFSLIIKKRCQHVYIVEPLPVYIDSLQKTFQFSDNTTIIEEGVSEHTNTLYIHDQAIASYIDNNPEHGIPISINTIDNLFYEKNIPINFIKADIEGFELQMLKGAIKTIKKNKPRIAVTTYHKKDDFKNIKNFLENLNLNYIIDKKGVFPNGAPMMLHAYVPGY